MLCRNVINWCIWNNKGVKLLWLVLLVVIVICYEVGLGGVWSVGFESWWNLFLELFFVFGLCVNVVCFLCGCEDLLVMEFYVFCCVVMEMVKWVLRKSSVVNSLFFVILRFYFLVLVSILEFIFGLLLFIIVYYSLI